MLGLGLVVAWRIRKSHEKADETLINLSTYNSVRAEPSKAAVLVLRSQTMRLWLLMWRASSESFLQGNNIPEGREIVTRRVILDKLEAFDLRVKLTDQERDLHLLPDGGWSLETITENLFRGAELQVLQYASGAIDSLPPIEDFDRIQPLNLDRIRTATVDTTWRPRETFDIRRERDMAAMFYLRCLGEQVQRGIAQGGLDQEHHEILNEATRNAGNENTDLLIGTKIISNAENKELNLATGQSYIRFTTLQHVLSLLESSECSEHIAPA